MGKIIKSIFKGCWFALALLCADIMLSAYLTTQMAKFLLFVIDGVVMGSMELPKFVTIFFFSNTVASKILVLSIFMLLIALAIALLNYFKHCLRNKLNIKTNENIKINIVDKFLKMPYYNFLQTSPNTILQNINSDAPVIKSYVIENTCLFCETIFVFFFSLLEIVKINVIGIIVIACILVLLIVCTIIYCALTNKIVKKDIDLSESLIEKTTNLVKNPQMIKMNARQQTEIEKFNKINSEYNKNNKTLIKALIVFENITNLIIKLREPIIILVVGILAIKGIISVGELMLILSYTTIIANNFTSVIYALEEINSFLACGKHLSGLYSIISEETAENVKLNNVELEFKNVSITVNGFNMFKNVNFKLSSGETAYLVGKNGCGKTLLAKTILGLYNYSGSISIGGVDVKEIGFANVRNNVGLVLQEPFAISATVKQNVDIGNVGYSQNEIETICKVCEIHSEIMGFKNGYSEIVGENGITLSGGQKQRLALARILIKNYGLIIFDDFLSKLDVNTRANVLNNLKNNFSNLIALHIVNDLENLKNEDRVLFIDNKKIVDSTHADLIKNNENYFKLYCIATNKVKNE